LDIEQEKASEVKSDFSFQIIEITHHIPAEVNQALFNVIYEEGVVNSEEECRARIKENLISEYAFSNRYQFIMDVRNMLLKKVGNDLEFSETLLKRIMKLNIKDKNEEEISKFYEENIEIFKWNIIKDQIAKNNNIKIDDESLWKAAQKFAKTQFVQYGMTALPNDLIEKYADNLLKKEESLNQMLEQALEDEVMLVLKEQIKLNNKTVSLKEYKEILSKTVNQLRILD
jgi:trigger factor